MQPDLLPYRPHREMVFVESASTDPSTNLAFEEYFLRHKRPGDDVLMLWRNQPAIVVGRYQSIFAEVNLEYAQAHGIQVVRRISGGGAVYHDEGNLCFSLIMDKAIPGMPRAAHLLRPVVQALTRLGLDVEVTQRNDLTLEGKKFSGHAMMVQKDRLLLHGTLLFNADLGALEPALDSPFQAIETRAIQSVRSRVTNLSPYLPSIATVEQFKQVLKELLLAGDPPAEAVPTAEERTAIATLAAEKYRSWAWTFGGDPSARVRCRCQGKGDELNLTLHLEKGYVQACHIDAQTRRPGDWEAIGRQMAHVRCDKDSVLAALAGTTGGESIGAFLARALPVFPR